MLGKNDSRSCTSLSQINSNNFICNSFHFSYYYDTWMCHHFISCDILIAVAIKIRGAKIGMDADFCDQSLKQVTSHASRMLGKNFSVLAHSIPHSIHGTRMCHHAISCDVLMLIKTRGVKLTWMSILRPIP